MTDRRPSRFDSYVPRRMSALGRGYSVFVRVLKYVLPLVALVIIGILVARLMGEKGVNLSSIAKEQKATPGQIELVGARYEGVDDKGRPYVVTADRAVRDMANAEALHFENPSATLTLESGAVFGMKGQSGFFDRAQQTLALDAGVTIDYSEGFSMTLKKVSIDLRAGTAKSDDPVIGTGALGAISAKNMTVTDGGDIVVFGGPATMKIALKGKSG